MRVDKAIQLEFAPDLTLLHLVIGINVGNKCVKCSEDVKILT